MRDQVQTILKRASKECVYTKRGGGLITPSRAGYPLLTQVLELLVLPKLPSPESAERLSFNSRMSIAQGYVYESALYDELCDKYGEDNVKYQVPTKYGCDLQGTADFVVTTEDEIIVIDAKAVNVDTKRELLERKIGNDNWSYRTQLAIYVQAMRVKEDKRNNESNRRKVRGEWYCWSPGAKKQWVVKLPNEEVQSLVFGAMWRVNELAKIKIAMEDGDFFKAVELACQRADELILPKSFFYGRPCASTSFHYNPYSELFFYDITADDEDTDDGFPIETELLKQVTLKLMLDGRDGVMLPYEEYLAELNATFS